MGKVKQKLMEDTMDDMKSNIIISTLREMEDELYGNQIPGIDTRKLKKRQKNALLNWMFRRLG